MTTLIAYAADGREVARRNLPAGCSPFVRSLAELDLSKRKDVTAVRAEAVPTAFHVDHKMIAAGRD